MKALISYRFYLLLASLVAMILLYSVGLHLPGGQTAVNIACCQNQKPWQFAIAGFWLGADYAFMAVYPPCLVAWCLFRSEQFQRLQIAESRQYPMSRMAAIGITLAYIQWAVLGADITENGLMLSSLVTDGQLLPINNGLYEVMKWIKSIGFALGALYSLLSGLVVRRQGL